MSDMKCPFCQQRLLQEYNRQRDAVIYHCTHCYFQGDGILWQELIRTRNALDIAVDVLTRITVSPETMMEPEKVVPQLADLALKQITALEQKDNK